MNWTIEKKFHFTVTDDPEDWGYLNHTFTFNLEGTRIVLKEFYDLIKSYSAIDGSDDRINMIEMYSNFQGALANCEVTLPYYNCSDFPFNFNFIFDAGSDGFVSADYIKDGMYPYVKTGEDRLARFIWNAEISISVAIHCYERLF